MIRLPKWVLTNPRPSIYDSESATAIEMTAKLYGAMSELVDEYNLFTDKVNAEIEKFEKSTDADIELFKVSIRQEFEDFIGVVEMKLNEQDKDIADAVQYLQDNLTTSIRKLLAEMRESGELDTEVVAVLNDLTRAVETRPVYSDCANTLPENVTETTSLYMTMGYREANDGGSGTYAIKEVESTENLSPASIVISENKVADLICDGKVNVKQFGAYGNSNDGTHDDAVYINKAIEYAHHHGCLVEIPPETFLISSPIILLTEVEVAGLSKNKSIIKLNDNANCNMFETIHFNSLVAGQRDESVYQPYRITLRNLKLDGNMANNEYGNGICSFASACTYENLFLTRIPQNGMYLAVRDDLVTTIWEEATKMASVVNNVDIYVCGEHGIYGDDAHDTFYNNLVIASPSQKADNTYDGIHFVNGGGRFVHFHGWNSSDEVGPRARYIMYFEGSQTLEVSTSHIEGGRTANLYVGSNGVFDNCRFYASYGEHIIEVNGSINTFNNCRFQERTDTNLKCVKFGSESRLNRFEGLVPTALKFADDSESGGCNYYKLSWWGQTKEGSSCVENLQPTSAMDIMANYTSWEGVSTVFPNMVSFKRNNVEETSMYLFNNDIDNLQLRTYDYVVVKSNANNKSVIVNSNKQPIGKKITFKNVSDTIFTYYFDGETLIDGVTRGSWYVSAQGETTLLKISDKEWITLYSVGLGGSGGGSVVAPMEKVYVFNNDAESLQLNDYEYVIVKSNANGRGINLGSDKQLIGKIVCIKNMTNANITYYLNTGTTLDGVTRESWYVGSGKETILLKINDKEWVTLYSENSNFYIIKDDTQSLSLGTQKQVIVQSNANSKGIILNSDSQPVGRELYIKNMTDALITFYFNSGTTLDGEPKESWYVSANTSKSLFKLSAKEWITL